MGSFRALDAEKVEGARADESQDHERDIFA
jgi:hypothetical protein